MYIRRLLWILLLGFFSQGVYATCIGVGCTCSISATTVAFGTYAPLSGSSVATTGTVSVTCSALLAGLNVSYVVTLNQGNAGSYTPRAMSYSSHQLQYNLFTDALHTIIWGDGTSGTNSVSDSYILSVISTTRNYTVYGQIPASQNVAVGAYTDSIIATVTF